QVLTVPLKDLSPANRLEVRKNGSGTAYYALQVTQDVRTPAFAPESTVPGLSVRREYFRMETRRDGAGRISVVPEKRPTTDLRIGDRVLVRVTLHNDRPLEYLMVEDPIPAGLEVQDRGDLSPDEWSYWWTHTDVRDDRVAFFIRDLAPGKHELEYYARPEMTGKTRVLPSVVSDMYVPSTRAATADTKLSVGR
ncbi:MAG TPA: hypothetical protein VFU47_10885, partial [Armatimonadota bacterium]|nr:hypothetical protein [Armatimonadota bacterium]